MTTIAVREAPARSRPAGLDARPDSDFNVVMSRSRPARGTRTGVGGFTAPELVVVDRFARAMAEGRYRSTFEAAPDCRQALAGLRARLPGLPEWSLESVRRVVHRRAAELGLSWTVSFWSRDELRLAEEYARQVIAGRIPSLQAAARELAARLASEFGRRRTADGAAWHMRRAMRALGVPAEEQEWTPEELRVLREYTRKAYAGRPCTVRTMAKACSRALGGRRSPDAVRSQMKKLVAATGLPRYHGFSVPWELAYFERYARRFGDGRYPSYLAAAEACYEALKRRHRRESRRAPGRLSPEYSRELSGVYGCIRRAGERLGLPRVVHVRWCDEERRVAEGWMKWYRRYRRVRRLQPHKQAAEGMRTELADLGYERTFAACSAYLTNH